jgi:beta-lactamase superfamily II metal-dependent hydrolase
VIFTLEALQADEGDCLLLHYGSGQPPRRILIDGGPSGVYNSSLKPRLQELTPQGSAGPSLALVMVSHIDADHITGLLDLFNACDEARQNQTDPPAELTRLWHNSFAHLVQPGATPDPASLGGAQSPQTRAAQAIAASVDQGRQLNDSAKSLNVSVNDGKGGFIGALEDKQTTFDLKEGLKLTVIHPDQRRLDRLQRLFEQTPPKESHDAALAAAFTDTSVPNLSSIVVLATAGNKTMLLTGDARGDDILAGLERAKLLDAGGNIELDVLKVPHHGSDRNVETDFFRRVRAKHYVISGDGTDGNPESSTLQMILDARGHTGYTLHLTNRTGNKGLGPRLEAFLKRAEDAGEPLPVKFRDKDALSLTVDLLDPLGAA